VEPVYIQNITCRKAKLSKLYMASGNRQTVVSFCCSRFDAAVGKQLLSICVDIFADWISGSCNPRGDFHARRIFIHFFVFFFFTPSSHAFFLGVVHTVCCGLQCETLVNFARRDCSCSFSGTPEALPVHNKRVRTERRAKKELSRDTVRGVIGFRIK
jgi:hypothetical protein